MRVGPRQLWGDRDDGRLVERRGEGDGKARGPVFVHVRIARLDPLDLIGQRRHGGLKRVYFGFHLDQPRGRRRQPRRLGVQLLLDTGAGRDPGRIALHIHRQTGRVGRRVESAKLHAVPRPQGIRHRRRPFARRQRRSVHGCLDIHFRVGQRRREVTAVGLVADERGIETVHHRHLVRILVDGRTARRHVIQPQRKADAAVHEVRAVEQPPLIVDELRNLRQHTHRCAQDRQQEGEDERT